MKRAATCALALLTLAACGDSDTPSTTTVAAATTAAPQTTVAAGENTVGGFLDAAAGEWGITLDPAQRECILAGIADEFEVDADTEVPFDELMASYRPQIPFSMVRCEVDITVATSSPTPLDLILTVLLDDEDVDPTPEQLTCTSTGFIDGFGSERLIALFGRGESTPEDDALAASIFTSCGFDGDAIVAEG